MQNGGLTGSVFVVATRELEAVEKSRTELIEKTSLLEGTVNRLDQEVKLQGKRVADAEEHKKKLVGNVICSTIAAFFNGVLSLYFCKGEWTE